MTEFEQLRKRQMKDYSFGHQQMYVAPIESIRSEHPKIIKVLDIGFGIGFGLKRMLQRNMFAHKDSLYLGIEPDKDSHDYVFESLVMPSDWKHQKMITLNKKFYEVNWRQINEQHTFDYAFVIEVVEHMAQEEFEYMLEELHDLVTDAIFLSTPDKNKSEEGKYTVHEIEQIFMDKSFQFAAVQAQWTNLWTLNPV